MDDELGDSNIQPDSENIQSDTVNEPSWQSRWLKVGLGLAGAILILILAWPSLRDQIAPRLGLAGGASLTELEQAAAADPENDALQYDLAGAYYEARRFEDSWAQFRAVEAYRVAADAIPGIVQAEQAVQANPTSKEAHFKLGTTLAHAQLLVPAEIAFEQAIALDGRYVDAHTNLGVVYYQMGRLTEALSEYDAALAVSPNDADVHYNKGAAYVQQALQGSVPDDALLNQGVSEFQRALEIDPDLPQAHFSLGVVYATRGQNPEAISEFQRFLELDSGSDPEATAAAQDYLTRLQEK
jgi:tetratricopeptide (TPR) repeat protein